MAEINNVVNVVPPRTSQPNGSVLGKEDFLRLLMEQIKVQDPLNPQDPSEFTAQLAQFSSLEQLYSLGDALQSLTLISASMNNTAVANFLGHEVTAFGDWVDVSSGEATEMRYQLATPAATGTLHIFDEDGEEIRTIELTDLSEGLNEYQWDGLTSSGEPAPDGAYTYSIEAKDAEGGVVPVETYWTGIVTGIAYENGAAMLEIGGRRVPLSDILSVRLSNTITNEE